LLDTQHGKPVVESWNVHRTLNAHDNVVRRARDAWGYVTQHKEHHCSCGSIMIARKARGKSFLGCSAFPECKQTRQIVSTDFVS